MEQNIRDIETTETSEQKAEGRCKDVKIKAGAALSVALSAAMTFSFVASSAWADGTAAARSRTGNKTTSRLITTEEIIDDNNALAALSTVDQALAAIGGDNGLLMNLEELGFAQIDLLEDVRYDVSPGGITSTNGKYIRHPVARGKVGVDVSEHNRDINWQAMKNSGLIDYAIIRCGYGKNLYAQDDKYWVKNVAGARSAGIAFGVYLYSYATDEAGALNEAEHVIRCLKDAGITPRELAYPVYYDLEESSLADEENRELLANMAKTFCNRIQQEGFTVGIYANMRWFNNFLTDPVFDTWTKWVAQYPREANFTYQYGGSGVGMWQCTSSGRVPGIYYPDHDDESGLGRADINFQLTPVPNYANNTGNVSGITNRYPNWSGIFPDLFLNDWYFKEVKWANETGVIKGMPDGSFRPKDNLDRAQLATILWRLAGEPDSTALDFVDTSDSYAAAAIRWARQVGIVEGVRDASDPFAEPQYQPTRAITREEFATMLGRYVRVMHGIPARTNGKKIGTYRDVHKVSSWAYDSFGWAVDSGIISGKSGIWLSPRDTTTRAEAATMLYRLNEFVAKQYASIGQNSGENAEADAAAVSGDAQQTDLPEAEAAEGAVEGVVEPEETE